MNTAIKTYLATIGAKGGQAARGASKRRTKAQCRKAQLASAKARKLNRKLNKTKI